MLCLSQSNNGQQWYIYATVAYLYYIRNNNDENDKYINDNNIVLRYLISLQGMYYWNIQY